MTDEHMLPCGWDEVVPPISDVARLTVAVAAWATTWLAAWSAARAGEALRAAVRWAEALRGGA